MPRRLIPAAPAAVVALAAVAFWRSTPDVFTTTKATVLVLGAVAVLAGLGVAALGRGRLRLPTGPWVVAVGALAVCLTIATVASPTPWRSAVGVLGRHGGLIPYLAALALGLVVAGRSAAAGPEHATPRRARGVDVLMAATTVVAGYALVQAVGADPLPWSTVEGGAPVFSTLGNVDFTSAWLGVVGVLLAGIAAQDGAGSRRRTAAGAVVVAAAVAAVATGSLQGPVVLALGLPAVALARWRPPIRNAVAVGGIAAVVAGGLALGPAAGLVDGAARSLETRIPKWRAALVMAADAPVVGRGLDTYGDWWFSARPPEVAAEEGLDRSVDNAHDVPLHLLAGGGVPTALAWLGAVVVVPAAGLWRRRRDLAWSPAQVGLVGAWGGYVVQALVSLDVPALMVLGWVLTGAVAALGGTASTRAVVLPSPAMPRRATAGVLIVVAALAVVPLTRPLRAELAAWDAAVARADGDLAAAAEATVGAMELAPWASAYPAAHGAWLTQVGQPRAALELQVAALEREPRSLTHALNVARLLTALGDVDGAALAYDRVAEIDPHTPAVQAEVAAGRPVTTPSDEGTIGPAGG